MTQVAPISPFASDPTALAIVERMRKRSPKADPLGLLPDVHPGKIPRHIAIIMDGNGRWAEGRGFPRMVGHRGGAATVREIVDEAGRLGIEALTLYSFSLENWKRPKEEIDALMQLCITYLEGERDHLKRENIRFRVIGRRGEGRKAKGESGGDARESVAHSEKITHPPTPSLREGEQDGLPESVVRVIEDVESATANCTGPILCLAINYGSRTEITDAVRKIAAEVAAGKIEAAAIDEAMIAANLYTGDLGELADPDLLIRTAGEMRISNFLLWQISYSELFVTETLWPDFSRASLHEAVRAFAGRRRRFGGLDEGV